MGDLVEQGPGDYQVVTFAITGEISQADKDLWNQAIANLKAKFPSLIGKTLVVKGTSPSPGPPASP